MENFGLKPGGLWWGAKVIGAPLTPSALNDNTVRARWWASKVVARPGPVVSVLGGALAPVQSQMEVCHAGTSAV